MMKCLYTTSVGSNSCLKIGLFGGFGKFEVGFCVATWMTPYVTSTYWCRKIGMACTLVTLILCLFINFIEALPRGRGGGIRGGVAGGGTGEHQGECQQVDQ